MRQITTTRPRVRLRGTATDNTGVTVVSYTRNNSANRAARGTSNWVVRSRAGLTRIVITTSDAAGNTSRPVVARIMRR